MYNAFFCFQNTRFTFKFVPVIARPKSHVISERDVTLCTSMQHQIWRKRARNRKEEDAASLAPRIKRAVGIIHTQRELQCTSFPLIRVLIKGSVPTRDMVLPPSAEEFLTQRNKQKVKFKVRLSLSRAFAFCCIQHSLMKSLTLQLFP